MYAAQHCGISRTFQPCDRHPSLQSILLGNQLWPDDRSLLVRRTSFISVQPLIVWMLSRGPQPVMYVPSCLFLLDATWATPPSLDNNAACCGHACRYWQQGQLLSEELDLTGSALGLSDHYLPIWLVSHSAQLAAPCGSLTSDCGPLISYSECCVRSRCAN